MFLHNFKLAFRKLAKNKLHAFLGIASFAVGFAVCIVIGLYIQNELTVDRCYEKHQQIFRMIDTEHDRLWIEYDDKNILLENYPEISVACPVELNMGWSRPVVTDSKSLYIDKFITTDNSFFDVFSIPIVSSLSEKPFSQINSAILTESTAEKLFGNENPLGKQITLDDNKELVVTAIIKNFPKNSSMNADVLLFAENSDIRASHCGDGKGNYFYAVNMFLLINEHSSKNELEGKINATVKQIGARLQRTKLQALTNIYLGPLVEGNDNKTGNAVLITIFGAIGLLILTLSVINYINFLLSFQLANLKEIGIRKTNGADFSQIMGYNLTEVSMWIVISYIFSLAIVDISLPFANQLFNRTLEIENLFSFPMIAFMVFSIMAVIFLSSLVPTSLLSKFDVRSFISGQFGGIGKHSVKRVLTTFQFAISIILLVGVLVIQKQIDFVKHKDTGFNKEQLLWLKLPVNYTQIDALKNRLLQHSSILKASITSGNPGNINYGTGDISINGNFFQISRISVDKSFLSTFGIELIDGRNFTDSDLNKSCLINETAYKKYGWENFQGHKFQEFNVVGVVKDFHIASMHKTIDGVSLVCKKDNLTAINLKISHVNIGATMQFIQKTWHEISPASPFEYRFYHEWFNAMYRDEEQLAQMIKLFAALALIIICMGLLGQTFQICINRTKEISIRKILGATVPEIVSIITKDFIRYALIANIFACPIAWYAMHKWLEDFAYRIEIAWWMFVLAGGIAFAIALLTISIQAVKAATANPVESLRYE